MRLEDQYWMSNNQLKVVGNQFNEGAVQDIMVDRVSQEIELCNQWRVEQLQRYGSILVNCYLTSGVH